MEKAQVEALRMSVFQKNTVMVLILFIIAGCSEFAKMSPDYYLQPAPYMIETVTDEFSANPGSVMTIMNNNCMTHWDPDLPAHTSQLNFFVTKRGSDIENSGIYFRNVRTYGQWLAIRKGDPLTVLADGRRMEFRAYHPKLNSSVLQSTTYYIDSAWYLVPPGDMAAIANSAELKIRVDGYNGVEIYSDKPYLVSFQNNLRRFLAENIEK